MAKGELALFAADDLVYEIPPDDTIEIEQQLVRLGWLSLETCPRCGSNRLFPPHSSQDCLVDVPCLTIEGSDLGKVGRVWSLTEAALQRFASSAP